MKLKRSNLLRGKVKIPGDKSISHRAVMFGAISEGTTVVQNFLQGADCLSTIDCFRKMGIEIENTGSEVTIHGKGLYGLSAPCEMLDTGNSGTTTRLISGILAGQSFPSRLNGDESIQKRPMKRILDPLQKMGASITSDLGNGCAPLSFSPARLQGIHYDSPVSSAQVKSCILLAGLYAEGKTTVTEPVLSRNHTELMLASFGAKITSEGTTAVVEPGGVLKGQTIFVPGDISSAAYFIAAGLLVPGSEVMIENVGINPTRDGILKAALSMGADITRLNERTASGEPVCDLLVRYSRLHGIRIDGELIPTLIDEIPMLAVMAAFAEGTTVIADAAELKVKETDRIATVTENLKRMGVTVTPTEDGMIIEGGNSFHGAAFESHLDHRIAMAFSVAALLLPEESAMNQSECVTISYPAFYSDLYSLIQD